MLLLVPVCFQILAIVYNAVVNIRIHIFLEHIHMYTFLGAELLDHTACESSISRSCFMELNCWQCMRYAMATNIDLNHGIFIALHVNHLVSVY